MQRTGLSTASTESHEEVQTAAAAAADGAPCHRGVVCSNSSCPAAPTHPDERPSDSHQGLSLFFVLLSCSLTTCYVSLVYCGSPLLCLIFPSGDRSCFWEEAGVVVGVLGAALFLWLFLLDDARSRDDARPRDDACRNKTNQRGIAGLRNRFCSDTKALSSDNDSACRSFISLLVLPRILGRLWFVGEHTRRRYEADRG